MFLPAGDLLNLPAPAEGAKLHILAIGVEQYEAASLLPLQYAARDAAAFAQVLGAQGRDSYSEIAAKVLVNKEARRSAILEAFEALGKAIEPQDFTVVFLAGHGVNHRETQAYHFAPFDLDERNYAGSAIDGAQICRFLWNMPGRRLLVVDTCNAGNVAADIEAGEGGHPDLHSTLLREMGSTRRPIRVRLSEPSSLAVLMATGRDSPAVESDRWEGGAFTRALIEGLQGGGENGTSAITLRTLCSYVRNRVRSLTRNQQEPRFAVAGGTEEDYEILRLSPERTRPALRSGDPLIGKSICGFKILARIEQTPRHTLYSGVSESAPQCAIQLRALSRELSRQAAEVQRFHLSARVLRQLRSPYFVEVHELGKLPDGRAHIIVRAAGRRRLRDVLSCGPLPVLEATRLLLFIAAAMGAAHRAGVLYFSLTPSRVLIDEQLEQFQLYDGENACSIDSPSAAPARPGEDPVLDEMDSIHYQAPECDAPGARLSGQVDVYALGALAFHALTGRAPYSGQTVGQIRAARRQGPPLPALDAPCAAALTDLIQRMLALDPQERPGLAEIESLLRSLSGAPQQQPDGARPETPQLATVRLPMHERIPSVPSMPQPLLPVQGSVPSASSNESGAQRPLVAPDKSGIRRHAGYALALSAGLVMLLAASMFALRLLEGGPDAEGVGAPLRKGVSDRTGPRAAQEKGKDLPVQSPEPSAELLPSEICLRGGTLPLDRVRPDQHDTLRIAPYCLDRTEVTNRAFLSWLAAESSTTFVGATAQGPRSQVWLRIGPPLYLDAGSRGVSVKAEQAEHPITHVTWEGAQAYCQAQGRRLPTEGQWLFAALAAASEPAWPWGQEAPGCGGAAVAGLCPQALQRPMRVGSAEMDHTPTGIDDLLGNVAEWVETRAESERETGHSYLGSDYRNGAGLWWQRRKAASGVELPHVGFRCARADSPRHLARRIAM